MHSKRERDTPVEVAQTGPEGEPRSGGWWSRAARVLTKHIHLAEEVEFHFTGQVALGKTALRSSLVSPLEHLFLSLTMALFGQFIC